MKSLEVTLYLNQSPADGVASVWLQERFYFCPALPAVFLWRASRCSVIRTLQSLAYASGVKS
jgi:hypothetical protein